MRQLHEKHPEAQDAKLGSFGPVEEVHDSLYQQIDGEMIREAALRTKGSGGPSGVDEMASSVFSLANPSRNQVRTYAMPWQQ